MAALISHLLYSLVMICSVGYGSALAFPIAKVIPTTRSLVAANYRVVVEPLKVPAYPRSFGLHVIPRKEALQEQQGDIIDSLWRRKRAPLIGSLLSVLVVFCRGGVALARTVLDGFSRGRGIGARGWDLFGRVPYDESLFTTFRLTDPNILKRSFAEAVLSEIPDALGSFQRKRSIHSTLIVVKGLVAAMAALCALGLILSRAREQIKKDRAREAAIRGFDMPISATYKGSQRRGRPIEGTGGWIDMSRTNDDDNTGKKRRPSEDDNENEEDDSDVEEEDNDDDE